MTTIRPGVRNLFALSLLFAAGCQWDDAGVAPCAMPEVLSSSVAANVGNVLSAIVTSRIRGADSVGVRFGIGAAARGERTPAISLATPSDSITLPVLGLRAETEYSLNVVAHTSCASVDGPVVHFTTGALPSDLPAYIASGRDPSPGFVVFTAGFYGLVIDNTGRVVWYYRFPLGAGLNFQAQPNGRYLSHPPLAGPPSTNVLVEVDPTGAVTRRLGCLKGLQARLHDFIAEADGSYWVMCDEVRTVDLSSTGGAKDAQVMGTGVQRVSNDGSMMFEWSPFEHFSIDFQAIDPADRGGATINWTHGNAIDLDSADNLLISFRNLSEITKIDTRTGAVLWRMGGRANQFTFAGDGAAPFARQHGLRLAGSRRMTLLDNLGDPAGSRAERYEIDEVQRTARLVASYGSGNGIIAQIGGTTQSLPGGRTLVSFGNGGRVEEYDSTGASIWRIEGNPGYVFRAQRILSLYSPGVGSAR